MNGSPENKSDLRWENEPTEQRLEPISHNLGDHFIDHITYRDRVEMVQISWILLTWE